MNKCLLEKLINNGTPDMYAAFAETIKQEIASDEDTYESIGYNLLKALLTDDADDILVALCGWYVDTLLTKEELFRIQKWNFMIHLWTQTSFQLILAAKNILHLVKLICRLLKCMIFKQFLKATMEYHTMLKS